jgi:hypothetical protein
MKLYIEVLRKPILLIIAIFFVSILPAQITKLTDLTGSGTKGRVKDDLFGFSVAVSKNIIVVGAHGHDFNSNGADSLYEAGAAYIFYKDEGGANNWGLKKKLTGIGNNGRNTYDLFGYSVDISGDVIVIGAYGQDFDANGLNEVEGAGAAYIFYKDEGGTDNWGLKAKLTAGGINSRNEIDLFGQSVTISGNIIVVASNRHNYDENGNDSTHEAGAAYIFYKDEGGTDNWGLKKKIVGSGVNGRLKEDWFGNAIAISGNIIVVGANRQDYDENGNNRVLNSGAAYIFYKDEGGTDNWGLKKKIVGDWFGSEVAISDDLIAVGANRQDYDTNGNDSTFDAGAVFIFYKDEGGTDNWGLKKKIVGNGSKNRNAFDNFGTSIKISKETLVVGAPGQSYNQNGTDSILQAGAAYVFNKNLGGTDNWGQLIKLTNTGNNSRHPADFFGISVALSENVIVIGAYGQDYDVNGIDSIRGAGKATIFSSDSSTTSINIPDGNTAHIYASSNGKKILLNFTETGNYTITVYDLMGRPVAASKTKGNTIKTLTLNGAATGYYIVKVNEGSYQQTFKVYIQ